MHLGFDSKWTYALVVHGHALDGLTWKQCASVAKMVAELGGALVAAPNGDLSATGTPNESSPDEPTAFSFVVGAGVATARVRADQAADGTCAALDEVRCEQAEAAFEAARARIEDVLARAAARPTKAPGLFVVAAGPLASAALRGDPGAEVIRLFDDGEREPGRTELCVSWDADPDAVRVELRGRFALTARYD